MSARQEIVVRFSGDGRLAEEMLAFFGMGPLPPITDPVYAWWYLRPTASGYSRVDSV